MTIFNHYTQKLCLFECALGKSREVTEPSNLLYKTYALICLPDLPLHPLELPLPG